MVNPAKIAKNTLYYILALIIQKIISFVYFAYLARLIGVEDVGKYIFAISFTTIFSVFIDLGLSPILTREIAKDHNKSQKYFENIISLKVPLALLIYLITIVVINFLNYPDLTKQLIYISGLAMMLDSFSFTFWAIFRGNQNLKYESIGSVIFQVIVAILGTIVLLTTKNLLFLMASLSAASLFYFTYALLLVKKKINVSFKLKFDKKIAILLLQISFPFALAGIFNRVYSYIDSVLLSLLAGDEAVGWYGVAYKLIFALQFIPMAFAAAIFPAMSSYFINSKELLAKTFEKATFYLTIIAIPLALGTFVLTKEIILTLYGEDYLSSTIVLKLLVFGLIFVFLNFPVGSLLNACDRQMTNTKNIGLVMCFSIVINLILIIKFSYVGAAITYLLSAILLYSLGLYWVKKTIAYNQKFILVYTLKSLFSSLIMALVLYYLKSFTSIIALIPLGIIIYLALMLLIHGLTKEDVNKVKAIFLKKTIGA